MFMALLRQEDKLSSPQDATLLSLAQLTQSHINFNLDRLLKRHMYSKILSELYDIGLDFQGKVMRFVFLFVFTTVK